MMDSAGKIRILLADEHALFREAVKAVLNSEGDLEVVAESGDGLQVISEVERTGPDVAMLDADLPGCNGIQATRMIKERHPECRVLILASQSDLGTLTEALDAGACGYLTKGAALSELIDAARRVYQGQILAPPEMLSMLLHRLLRRNREQEEARRRMAHLTRREREVLAMLAEGTERTEIAKALGISPETVRTHIQHVLVKLGAHSRLEAAAFVLQQGMLDDLPLRSQA